MTTEEDNLKRFHKLDREGMSLEDIAETMKSEGIIAITPFSFLLHNCKTEGEKKTLTQDYVEKTRENILKSEEKKMAGRGFGWRKPKK